jgi:hypothetical protein
MALQEYASFWIAADCERACKTTIAKSGFPGASLS